MKTILVIDPSPSIRETLRIVLGREHELALAASADVAPAAGTAALVILGLPPPPRDDRAIGHALSRIAPDVPVLLLHAPAEADVQALAAPDRRLEFAPKPFDAVGIRARVRTLLSEPPPVRRHAGTLHDLHRAYLEYPFLTPAAAVIARDAIVADLPVLLVGERGTGALEVARALHVFGGRVGPFTVIAAQALAPGELGRRLGAAWDGSSPRGLGADVAGDEPHHGTLYLERVHEAPLAVQEELLALATAPEGGQSERARLLASTSEDLTELAARGRFLPELAYVLGTLTLPLTPLRERYDDIAALVDHLTTRLVARLRLEPVTYTAAALEVLRNYLWFGNVAELTAVLGRTLALWRPRLVEPAQLVFFPEDALAAAAARATRPPAPRTQPAAAASVSAPNLEIVLGELAHELRNPMVTIKTFAQHLDSVLADPEVRARFASLTSDAIARMDGLLETLLAFARFRTAAPQPLDLATLFERALAERAEELERKGVRVERNGTAPTHVEADEAQVLFALRSILDGLIRDLVPHQPLRVRATDAGVVELEVRAERAAAERLRGFVEDASDEAGNETLPLPLALAATLLRRNRGSLRVRSEREGTTIVTVALPSGG